ncbi:MAG: putative lipid II flippase FtsW [Holosporales bacterium]|nr:putative lipid II flippase FtsW [Holosporales bacterium]
MQKLLRRWWLSIDRVSAFVVVGLISIGAWVSIASTPAVAIKLGLSPFYFFKHHLIVMPIGVFIIIVVSLLQVRYIRRFAMIGYVICILFLLCVFIFGEEIKGARRWISLFGFSLQPSEFLKPTLVVITAWLISEQYTDRKFPGIVLSIIGISIVIPLLLSQPDVGMAFIIVTTWIAQLFVSGLSVFMIAVLACLAVASLFVLYITLPHFAERIDEFLTGSGDTYQVQKSIEAFKNGGFLGKGPGEGVIKTLVPDAHSDFVFSVIGEEFGFILCSIIIIAFIFFAIRSLIRVMNSSNMFNFTAIFGISFQLIMQVLINIATSLNLIPTKGMTLPFISYGGSSFLATSISVGVLLAITRSSAMDYKYYEVNQPH